MAMSIQLFAGILVLFVTLLNVYSVDGLVERIGLHDGSLEFAVMPDDLYRSGLGQLDPDSWSLSSNSRFAQKAFQHPDKFFSSNSDFPAWFDTKTFLQPMHGGRSFTTLKTKTLTSYGTDGKPKVSKSTSFQVLSPPSTTSTAAAPALPNSAPSKKVISQAPLNSGNSFVTAFKPRFVSPKPIITLSAPSFPHYVHSSPKVHIVHNSFIPNQVFVAGPVPTPFTTVIPGLTISPIHHPLAFPVHSNGQFPFLFFPPTPTPIPMLLPQPQPQPPLSLVPFPLLQPLQPIQPGTGKPVDIQPLPNPNNADKPKQPDTESTVIEPETDIQPTSETIATDAPETVTTDPMTTTSAKANWASGMKGGIRGKASKGLFKGGKTKSFAPLRPPVENYKAALRIKKI